MNLDPIAGRLNSVATLFFSNAHVLSSIGSTLSLAIAQV
jgi:hypothetical protein